MKDPLRYTLRVIAGMMIQHVGDQGRLVDGCGVVQAAMRLFADFGFMELLADPDGRLKAQWTEAGKALLKETPSAMRKGQRGGDHQIGDQSGRCGWAALLRHIGAGPSLGKETVAAPRAQALPSPSRQGFER